MKILTLSFLTESKASYVCLSSIRRVAITLLVMLLTTASAWAQEGPVIPTPKIYTKVTPENGGEINDAPTEAKMGTQVQFTVAPAIGYKIKSVSLSDPGIYNLAGSLETGQYSFTIGSADVTIEVVFEENFSLKYNTNESGNQAELSEYEGDLSTGFLNIPTNVTIDGISYSVTSIGESAFSNCGSLTSVTIPSSVTSIGYSAFSGCIKLQSVTIPESVTSIGNNAFRGCSNLQSVTIPNSVTSIADFAFADCSSIQSVTIPSSVTSIGYSAFEGCIKLQSVTIPSSVTSIGIYAFAGCSNLQSVTIPNSVTTIGDAAFGDCSNLETVTIPNSVMNIGRESFWGCRNLQSVTIYGNPNIGIDAFWKTPATVAINLTASEIGNDYWTTFYNDGYNFQADENTTVYKGTVNESSLMLTEVEDKIVNSGTAVILKSSGNPVMTLTETGSNDTNSNDLRGISDRDLRTDVIANISDANAIYTMGNTSAGFGFHRYTDEYIPAGKAFLPLYIENEAGAKALSLAIVFANETTGINSVFSDSNVQNDWFTLDGTRLSGKPTLPGIYINGKKKIAIK